VTLIAINSTAVAAIGYENGTLFVLFHDNPKIYPLPNVSYDLFQEFLNSTSPGTFWNRYLRGKFK
jgi:hypothetical protein